MVVGARWAGLSISQSAQLLGFSCTAISRVCVKREKHPVGYVAVLWEKMPC